VFQQTTPENGGVIGLFVIDKYSQGLNFRAFLEDTSGNRIHPVLIALIQEAVEPIHSIGYFVYKVCEICALEMAFHLIFILGRLAYTSFAALVMPRL
jgi:hypothetical protein